jgi:hypothetical protein
MDAVRTQRYQEDNDLDVVELSLPEFVASYVAKANANQKWEAIQLALLGLEAGGQPIYLDALKDQAHQQRTLRRVAVLRDIDSIIGMSRTLPYVEPLDFILFSPPHLSLKANNHMTRKVVRSAEVPLLQSA